MRGRRRITTIAAGALALLLALGALVAWRSGSGTSDSSSAQKALGGATAASPALGLPEAARSGAGGVAADGAASSGGATSLPPVPASPTRVVKTATVDVGVRRGGVRDATDSLLAIVTRAGGYVASTTQQRGLATLTLRVPAARFEETLAAVRRLGTVRAQSVSGQDVTAQYVDLESRLRAARAQEAVLLDLMSRARSVPDTIAVQQQLAQTQQQIEELEGQRRLLDDQTSLATLQVTLHSPAAAGSGGESILAGAWARATGAALAVLGGTLVVLGALVPLVLVLGVPALVAWAVLSRRRRPAPVAG